MKSTLGLIGVNCNNKCIRFPFDKPLNSMNISIKNSVECVSKIKSVLSTDFREIYGLWVLSLPISLVMILRIHVFYLIIII